MSDIKSPDIQVIENKLQKIKEHISLYRGRSMYKPTRDRLRGVLEDLDECAVLINEILAEASNKYDEKLTFSYNYDVVEEDSAPKQEFDSDLFDTFTDSVATDEEHKIEEYSSKFIVQTYRKRIDNCANTRIGIIQVNQFLTMLNSWFITRYSPDEVNSGFKYKASRIHEWVDLVILASGNALHNKTFPIFKGQFDEWISTINSSRDKNWVLPKEVMKFKNCSASDYTEEAIVLERILKKMLYDSQFYPNLKDSVEKIVIDSRRFGSVRKTLQELLTDCKPSFIVASGFEPDKF